MTGVMKVVGVLGLLLSGGLAGPVRADEDPWGDFRFLIGAWVNEGKPGEASGGFTLEPDLGGKVLVRRNRAEVPAAPGRPAGTHEDLMVIFREPGAQQVRASYFDNEGHVIRYAVAPRPGKAGLSFVSDPAPSGPRFRLTYTPGGDDTVAVKFEVAPPGQPDGFRTYLEGSARRKKPGP